MVAYLIVKLALFALADALIVLRFCNDLSPMD